MRKNWTAAETERLTERFGRYSLKNITQELGRSEGAIWNKAKRLGITLKENQDWFTLAMFCEQTKLSRTTVQYWVDHCEFPAKKNKAISKKYMIIYPKKFWEWAENNKHRIQWVDFPKWCLAKEPAWVAEARRGTAKRTTKRKVWTKDEIRELKYLLGRNKYTYPELSKMLNRSHAAIKRKIYDLELPWPVYVNRRIAPRYSENEIKKAVRLYENGQTLAAIASELGRTEAGLRGKLERSGYRFKGKQLLKKELTNIEKI